MKTQELIDLLKTGAQPTVMFVGDKYDGTDADKGMLGRLIAYCNEEDWGEGEKSISFKIDMSEFFEYNKTKMEPNWYDKDETPRLKWYETTAYPKDHIEQIWVPLTEKGGELSELPVIQIHEPNKYLQSFLGQKEFTNYNEYLESLLDRLRYTEYDLVINL